MAAGYDKFQAWRAANPEKNWVEMFMSLMNDTARLIKEAKIRAIQADGYAEFQAWRAANPEKNYVGKLMSLTEYTARLIEEVKLS